MLRVCYLWEMGLMVKTSELARMRERRLAELEKRRAEFEKDYQITEHEQNELANCSRLIQSHDGGEERFKQ